ncbi:Pex19 protein family-domain-containing protein [Aspergillus karnatakaensis]|uniref:putative peroxisomal membrane protein receptor Pex19 n=1 Tax=Aspergillus karnatakaensis TaxID=1810916 RepID=UPI003CCCB958
MASSTPPAVGDSQPTGEQTIAQAVQQTNTPAHTEEKAQDAVASPAPVSSEASQPQLAQQQSKQSADDDDDDESDFDELDDVLDNFKPTAPQPPSAASPAQPPTSTSTTNPETDEFAFMNQLEKDMARMMGQAAQQSGAEDSEGFESAINQGADAFTKQLEDSGIAPGDFIKQLLADVMAEQGEGEQGASGASGAAEVAGAAAAATAAAATGNEAEGSPESFNDAIQRTINRMKESGDKATAAASEDNADDLIAQLLKAMEAGGDGAGGDDGDLTKIFMGMMEQLSNKDMLYEPMKELDTKFGPWLKKNKGKGSVSEADMERYEKQAELVSLIVRKFEEKGYTDEDPKCREYVWEKMQAMQAAGNPPDELVANPWMDDLKGGGGPGVPDCPQQ